MTASLVVLKPQIKGSLNRDAAAIVALASGRSVI
jgi:hypothetical protein